MSFILNGGISHDSILSQCKTRIVMAPLTRCRAVLPEYAPNSKLQGLYYEQRAGDGGRLLITEATCISSQGRGYKRTPGIYTESQCIAWTNIVSRIHAQGSIVFMQLWHVGRASHNSFHGNCEGSVVSSTDKAIPSLDGVFMCQTETNGPQPYSKPRKLTPSDIYETIIPAYEKAAHLAKQAGFDGIEIHAANGYLLQQFLEDGVNEMDLDSGFGGLGDTEEALQNRCRLTLLIVDSLIKIWGSRVGIRISPFAITNGVSDSNPIALYDYLLNELDKRPMAYIHIVEPVVMGGRDDVAAGKSVDFFLTQRNFSENVKKHFIQRNQAYSVPSNAAIFRSSSKHPFITAGGLTRDSALSLLKNGWTDFVAFGRYFISNPDLPERLERNQPLTPYDRAFFYEGEAKGYTDYAKIKE